jgi:peptidyl-prolyl cis-trans isomerase C
MSYVHKLTAAMAVLVLAFAGCAKKADLVATVGDQVITTEEFEKSFGVQPQSFSSYDAELEQRQKFLDGLVDQKLLLIGAYRQGLDKSDEIQRLIEQQQSKFLLDDLYKKEIVEKVTVDDATVRTWYDNMGEEIHARHILLSTRDSAMAVKAELDGGADFGTLARERSKDPSAQQNAGDLGWFRWGAMVQPFQTSAFALKDSGSISEPVQTDFGWHVIQLLGRRQVDRQPFDQVKEAIRQQLTQQGTGTRLREFLDDIKAKAELRLDPDQLALVRQTYRDTTGPLPYASNLDLEKLNEKQKIAPIVRYLDTMLSTGQFITLANQVPPVNRPSFDDTLKLKEFIFQMIYVPILEREARRLRIDQGDSYRQALQQFKESLMADKMRTDLVQRPVDVSTEQARAYYDQHPEEFSSPPQVRVREALVATQKEAEDIVTQVRRGAKFDRICAQVTLRPNMKGRSGDLGMFRRFSYPNLFDAAQKMEVGQVGGPVLHSTPTGTQYSVIELMERQDAMTQNFEEVQDRILNKLRNDGRMQALDDWLAQMRGEVKVQVNADVLAGMIDKSRYPEKG